MFKNILTERDKKEEKKSHIVLSVLLFSANPVKDKLVFIVKLSSFSLAVQKGKQQLCSVVSSASLF